MTTREPLTHYFPTEEADAQEMIALLEKLGQGRPDRERDNLLFDPAELRLEPLGTDPNRTRFSKHDAREEEAATHERERNCEPLPVPEHDRNYQDDEACSGEHESLRVLTHPSRGH